MRPLLLIILCILSQMALAQDRHFLSLSNLNEIQKIVPDHDTLWIATLGGVQKRLTNGTLVATYTKREGLPVNSVNNIVIDGEGNKWFMYYNIITKFNNREFKTIIVPDSLLTNSSIRTLAVDNSGNVWFGLSTSALMYDGTNYHVYEQGELGNPTMSSAVEIKIDSKGQIWFGKLWGVFMFNGEQWVYFSKENGLPDNQINALEIDDKDRIWIATGAGVAYYEDGKWNTPESDKLPNPYVTDIFIIDDQVWASTLSGIVYYENNTWNTTIVDHPVNTMTVDRNKNIWYQNNNEFDLFSLKNQTSVNSYHVPSTIGDNTIYKIVTDTTGTFWFATNNGVSRFDGTNWSYFRTEDGIAGNLVRGIDIDAQNNVWIATTRGVSKYDGKSWKSFKTQDGLISITTTCIKADSKGNIWVGTWNDGVMKFDGSNWINYTVDDGLISNYITKIAVDSLDRVIVSGYDGISIHKDDNWSSVFISPFDIPHTDMVDALFVDDQQKIWVGFFKSGLYVVEEDSIYSYNSEYDFTGYPVSEIFVKNSNIYVTSGKGLSIFDGITWKNYSYKDALPFANLITIFPDANENLWFGGSGGLAITKLGNNHVPTKITAASDSFSIQKSNNLITRLITADEDLFDIHQYTVIPDPSTDYEYVSVINDELWLIKDLPTSQKTLTVKLRSTDLNGSSIDNLIKLSLSSDAIITAVAEDVESSIKVYPIPTNDYIQIEGITASASISLLDAKGIRQNVISTKSNNGLIKVDLNQFNSGLYILKVVDKNKSEAIRVLKQ